MELLSPAGEEEINGLVQGGMPAEMSRTFPVDAMIDVWPWQTDFLHLFNRYWAARRTQSWSRALRALHQARCFAIAGEQWELESWLNHLIVEAIAKREARRR